MVMLAEFHGHSPSSDDDETCYHQNARKRPTSASGSSRFSTAMARRSVSPQNGGRNGRADTNKNAARSSTEEAQRHKLKQTHGGGRANVTANSRVESRKVRPSSRKQYSQAPRGEDLCAAVSGVRSKMTAQAGKAAQKLRNQVVAKERPSSKRSSSVARNSNIGGFPHPSLYDSGGDSCDDGECAALQSVADLNYAINEAACDRPCSAPPVRVVVGNPSDLSQSPETEVEIVNASRKPGQPQNSDRPPLPAGHKPKPHSYHPPAVPQLDMSSTLELEPPARSEVEDSVAVERAEYQPRPRTAPSQRAASGTAAASSRSLLQSGESDRPATAVPAKADLYQRRMAGGSRSVASR